MLKFGSKIRNLQSFKVVKKDKKSNARMGKLPTPHGIINTPAFIPVATQASLKSLDTLDIKEIGPEVILANTYHLHLRPGEDVIKHFGGLGKFMGWDGPTMTDSGGFQVFSLGVGGEVKLLKPGSDKSALHSQFASAIVKEFEEAKPRLNKITEEGVYFQSHIDGRRLFLTPEKSIQIQTKLGADLIVAFDELESPHYSYTQALKSLERTERWELRSRQEFDKIWSDRPQKCQLLYGVTHGGRFQDLRTRSAEFVNSHFAAVALGGAHASKNNMYEVIEWTLEHVDENKPRHMLGVGEIDDIFNIVSLGIDTFDCVIPTRMGRVGWIFAAPPLGSIKNRFRYDITKMQYQKDNGLLDPSCSCRVCSEYTRGYINHLFRARELLAYRLATYHNVYFFTNLMRQIRESIENSSFSSLKTNWLGK